MRPVDKSNTLIPYEVNMGNTCKVMQWYYQFKNLTSLFKRLSVIRERDIFSHLELVPQLSCAEDKTRNGYLWDYVFWPKTHFKKKKYWLIFWNCFQSKQEMARYLSRYMPPYFNYVFSFDEEHNIQIEENKRKITF